MDFRGARKIVQVCEAIRRLLLLWLCSCSHIGLLFAGLSMLSNHR